MAKLFNGFSKLPKRVKREWLAETCFENNTQVLEKLKSFDHTDKSVQVLFDGFSENTVANFYLPYGIVPNMVVNGVVYCVPMVTEESSVVAAASAAAKFWSTRGGINAEVISTKKIGQVHFMWAGDIAALRESWGEIKAKLIRDTDHLTESMRKRGGGITQVELLDFTQIEPNYLQLRVNFETCDSMGANFINTVLEQMGQTLTSLAVSHPAFVSERQLSVVMAILSNYTPECTVRAWVTCPISELTGVPDLKPETFAQKFNQALHIAWLDPYRAVTHNKGIYNGIDAIVIATGNDFRAIEACGHAFAARDGQYRSLSKCRIEDGQFHFQLELPLAVGSVGGLTAVHPMAKFSLDLLGNPSAQTLMTIIAATGLAQNFAAVRSLVSTGIQKGHMKMHLHNILQTFFATDDEYEAAFQHFEHHVVSYSAVREYLEQVRE